MSYTDKNMNFFNNLPDVEKPQDHALDGIIAFLYLASRVLTQSSTKNNRAFDPLNFRFEHSKGTKLFSRLQGEDLIEKTLTEAEKTTTNVECAKLIVCKTKLFVEGMQTCLRFLTRWSKHPSGFVSKSNEEQVQAWLKLTPENRLYFFLPDLGQVIESGDVCDLRFARCLY